MKNKSVAIIGAGIGGLSCAARLASAGFEVEVFEQADKAGGKANSLKLGNFRFDTGPSLLTMPFVLEELFSDLGENLEDYIELNKLDVNCKYFFPDNTIFKAYSDLEKLINEVDANFIENGETLKEYLNYSEEIYNLTHEIFLNKSLNELSTYTNKKALITLLNIFKIDSLRSMHKANKSFFSDERLIQLFDRYATYNGSNPFKAPATLNVIQHVEYNIGGYVPGNGIYEIPDSIYKLAKRKGVIFHFNTVVNKIDMSKSRGGNLTYGVNGKNFVEKSYDIIVSNADVNSTYKYLLNDHKSRTAKRYNKLTPSTSALVFYWAVDGVFNDLEVHNILFSENYKKEFEDLFTNQICPDDPTIYIYISSKYNSNDAPDGCENWYVMINAPFIQKQDWNKEIEKSRKNIVNRINKTLNIDIEKRIRDESILSPVDIEKNTSSFKGSLYGISSNSRAAAFLRQSNRSRDYKGLYFCGGSAHPGGGIPLVMLSGKITSELVKKYEL
jgi:phytoene desaturase